MTDISRYYEESYPPDILGPPPPTVTLLTPSTVSLASMPSIVTITGTGFAIGMSVLVDGVVSPSGAYSSPTQATFGPSATVPGTQQISVRVDGVVSNVLPLTVTALADEEPTSAWSKSMLVEWLQAHGVTMTEDALMRMSKAELLELAEDLLSEEPG